jgi:hypothetical protein
MLSPSTAEWSARSKRETTMQNMEQKNLENRVLADDELDAINGGRNWLGKLVHAIHDLFAGPGDLRRPLDRPN